MPYTSTSVEALKKTRVTLVFFFGDFVEYPKGSYEMKIKLVNQLPAVTEANTIYIEPDGEELVTVYIAGKNNTIRRTVSSNDVSEFFDSKHSRILEKVRTEKMSTEDLGFYMILIVLCSRLLHWGEISIMLAFQRGMVVEEVFSMISKDDKLNKVAEHATDVHAWTGPYSDETAEPIYH